MDNSMKEILPMNCDGRTPVSSALMILWENKHQKVMINPAPNRHIEKIFQVVRIGSNTPRDNNSEPIIITKLTSFLLLLRRFIFMDYSGYFIQQ